MSASASASASSSDLRGDLPSVLCSAAGEGDVQGLRSILDAKVDGVTVNGTSVTRAVHVLPLPIVCRWCECHGCDGQCASYTRDKHDGRQHDVIIWKKACPVSR